MISAELVSEVSRTTKTQVVSGWALTFQELIKSTVSGDWESGYHQLTPRGARKLADRLNKEKPWKAPAPTPAPAPDEKESRTPA